MAMNETMVANLTAEELAHYASVEPSVVEHFGRERFVDYLAGEAADLRAEVEGLEQALSDYEDSDLKELSYCDWQTAHSSVTDIRDQLVVWCEDQKLKKNHPLREMLEGLHNACDKVHDLYY